MSLIRLLIVSLTYFNLVASDLIINALTGDQNGHSRFQCWEMPDPFEHLSTMNDGDFIFDYSTVNRWERLGLQRTTRPRLSFVLTGKCHIWLPDESEELWLGGEEPVSIVVADVGGTGHYARCHAIRSSLEAYVSFVDDIMPEHTVLYNGTCQARDLRRTSDSKLLAELGTLLEADSHELSGSMGNDVESYLHQPHPIERPTIATAATTTKASTVDAIWRDVYFTEQAQQQPYV